MYEEILNNNLPLEVRDLEIERQQLRQDIKELLEKDEEQKNMMYETQVEAQRVREERTGKGRG